MTQVPVGDPDKPSRRVIEQRVRNRIIEYVELASSFEAQQEYERDVPIAHIPYEVINQWEDEWNRLRDAAGSALSVFMRRGKMSEDHEVA